MRDGMGWNWVGCMGAWREIGDEGELGRIMVDMRWDRKWGLRSVGCSFNRIFNLLLYLIAFLHFVNFIP